MTTTELDLATLMSKAAVGEIEAVLGSLLPAPPAPASSRSTVATRKAAQRKAIEEFDLDRLIALQDKMKKIIDVLTANELDSGTAVLSAEKAQALMAEFLDVREIAELLDVRKEMIREAVFAHLDALAEARGEPDPANTNGALEVPELGKKFCREGTGYGTPVVDEQRLQALLGDRWLDACDEEVVPEVYIPERIEYRLSVEKVLDMARRDPAVLEALRSCLVPGKRKTPRMTVRDM